MGVIVARCKLFNETAQKYLLPGSALRKSFDRFVETKLTNPIASYGSSDKTNPAGTPMAQAVPKIRHAHLSSDISIFYTVSGANPTVLRLYALLSHSEAGTGQPLNKRKNQGMATKMANQEFT